MPEQATRWIRFLRRYGPIARNDNMYDEHIQKSARRSMLKPIVFEHPQQSAVLALFEPGNEISSTILTGTAGDGKTFLCRKVWQQITEDETAELDRDHVELRVAGPDGREVRLHVIKDLSEWAPQKGADWEPGKSALMQRLSESIFDPDAQERFLIAANDGQLIGSWKRLEQTEAVQKALAVFETLLVEDRNSIEGTHLQFFNLSRGSSLSLLTIALDAFLMHDQWEHCYAEGSETGFFGPQCPIRHNYELLKTPLVQQRLGELFELCDYNDLHVPIRGILMLLANAVLGHPEVRDRLMRPDDIPNLIQSHRVSKGSLYNNLFGGNLTETRGEGIPVFEYLNRLRIGFETSNRIDNTLIYGHADEHLKPYFDALIRNDRFYGADETFLRAQFDYVEAMDESQTVTDEFLDALVRQRRGLFFKIPPDQEHELRLWDLTVFRYAGEYLNQVVRRLKCGKPVGQPTLARLVRGLNRIFSGMLMSDDRSLYLATSISYSHARISRILRDSISVRPRKDERIEVAWDASTNYPFLRVVFSNEVDAVLQLNLVRFEFLSRVAEGALPNSFSRECHEDILAFKSHLLAKLEEREKQFGNTHANREVGTLVFNLLELDSAGNPSEEVIEVARHRS